MGLTLWFLSIPTPRRPNYPDHRLPAGMDVDVLHRDLLLTLPAVAVECVEQHGVGAGELVRLGEALAPALKGLLTDHAAAVAFHCRIVGDPRAARSPSEFDRETPQLRGGVVNAIEVTLRYVRHHDIERI
jgi:hypothetical protein